MEASRVLSRFLPVAEGDISVYEGRRRNARQSDLEAQALRQRGNNESFKDYDSDNPEALMYDATENDSEDHIQSPGTVASPLHTRAQDRRGGKRRIEDDDDVPESLLLEAKAQTTHSQPSSKTTIESNIAQTEAQWRATQAQHTLHSLRPLRGGASSRESNAAAAGPPRTSDPRAVATWQFTNTSNLDRFLSDVYQYYIQHGVWSILLARAISLLTELFAFSFATFLSTCIDYSKIPTSKSTAEVMIPKCMSKASWIKNVALFLFVVYWLHRLQTVVRDVPKLFRMHNFYLHGLGINDDDIQTVSWVRVVDSLVKMQSANVATANPSARVKKYLEYPQPPQRLSAESIANRLMRQDNYYIALYNKEIIDLTVPLPFLGSRQFYSKSLEWAISTCFTNFIFDEAGDVRPFCLDVKNRHANIDTLRSRFQQTAVLSIICAPWNILRYCTVYFFRYYTEFTKNPARASARTFTPYAEWKIREFNELDYLFQLRLRQAHPFANEYLKQFPKDKTDQICRFVAFVTGAIAAVLALATLFDPELFLGFEVTPGRTAVFWLTLMGLIFGVAHGSLPDENEVHDPINHLKAVLMYTRYMPAHWKDRLHSNEVRSDFSALFQMKVVIFLEEVLSLILAPWILWRNSGKQAERIIDFFREQTVHVEGIGHQCNFAVFGFKKDLNAEDPSAVFNEPDGLRDDYYNAKDDKMAQSVQHFVHYYNARHDHPRRSSQRFQGWQPPPYWPVAPPAIAEEPGPSAATVRRSPSGGKRSAFIDARRRPPSSLLRSPPRQTSHSSAHRTLGQRFFEDNGRHGVSESKLMAQDSDLQDFADAPGADHLDSDTEDEEGRSARAVAAVGVKNAGVLGMLAQYTKAQTEGGGGVANI